MKRKSAGTSSGAGSWSGIVRSSGCPDLLTLDRDLPTTAADGAALQRARAGRQVSLDEYLEFLQRFEAPPAERLRARRGPVGPPLDLGP